jgi:hypothetical protein
MDVSIGGLSSGENELHATTVESGDNLFEQFEDFQNRIRESINFEKVGRIRIIVFSYFFS